LAVLSEVSFREWSSRINYEHKTIGTDFPKCEGTLTKKALAAQPAPAVNQQPGGAPPANQQPGGAPPANQQPGGAPPANQQAGGTPAPATPTEPSKGLPPAVTAVIVIIVILVLVVLGYLAWRRNEAQKLRQEIESNQGLLRN